MILDRSQINTSVYFDVPRIYTESSYETNVFERFPLSPNVSNVCPCVMCRAQNLRSNLLERSSHWRHLHVSDFLQRFLSTRFLRACTTPQGFAITPVLTTSKVGLNCTFLMTIFWDFSRFNKIIEFLPVNRLICLWSEVDCSAGARLLLRNPESAIYAPSRWEVTDYCF